MAIKSSPFPAIIRIKPPLKSVLNNAKTDVASPGEFSRPNA
jgi:hypothetical protein